MARPACRPPRRGRPALARLGGSDVPSEGPGHRVRVPARGQGRHRRAVPGQGLPAGLVQEAAAGGRAAAGRDVAGPDHQAVHALPRRHDGGLDHPAGRERARGGQGRRDGGRVRLGLRPHDGQQPRRLPDRRPPAPAAAAHQAAQLLVDPDPARLELPVRAAAEPRPPRARGPGRGGRHRPLPRVRQLSLPRHRRRRPAQLREGDAAGPGHPVRARRDVRPGGRPDRTEAEAAERAAHARNLGAGEGWYRTAARAARS